MVQAPDHNLKLTWPDQTPNHNLQLTSLGQTPNHNLMLTLVGQDSRSQLEANLALPMLESLLANSASVNDAKSTLLQAPGPPADIAG
jgi:hypothetical protein